MSRRGRIKKRKSRKRLAYGVIAVIFIFLCFLTYFSLQQSNQTSDGDATPPQAAIVDHLDFTGQPNPSFVNACEAILDEGGLTWKYYKGENVTVDFYRNLPSYGSSLIILRVHSAIMKVNGEIVLPPLLGLFTSELYSSDFEAALMYPEDVEDDRLVRAFFPEQDKEYFGIAPRFVEKSMKGEFKDAVVIMMGCEGLGYRDASTGAQGVYTDMAKAFMKRGAKVYISWDGPVGVNYTDQATLDLLQSLILGNRTIKDAVGEIDADPYYESTLKFYPDGARNYVIPNVRSGLTMNVAYTSPTPRRPTKSKYTAHGWCRNSQH